MCKIQIDGGNKEQLPHDLWTRTLIIRKQWATARAAARLNIYRAVNNLCKVYNGYLTLGAQLSVCVATLSTRSSN